MIAYQVFKEQFYARDFVDLLKLLKRITTIGLQVGMERKQFHCWKTGGTKN